MDVLATRAIIRADERRRGGRKIVWSWSPDAETKLRGSDPRGDGGNKARSQEHGISVKTIAQGMPDDRLNLWFLPRVFFTARGAMGCGQHPAFPAPSRLGARAMHARARARQRRETANGCFSWLKIERRLMCSHARLLTMSSQLRNRRCTQAMNTVSWQRVPPGAVWPHDPLVHLVAGP